MNWWCAATGQSWTWEWRAFPGVWLFVVAVAAGYFRLRRGAGAPGRGGTWFAIGLLLLWVALDWPLGALGAGYQLGALLVDLAWIGGGLWLWWPVMAPNPEVSTFRRPLKMAYLFAATLPAIIPSAFLTFAEYPLYATYELAPRVARLLTAQEDQKIAGLLMKLVGDLPIWFAFGVIFFRWSRDAEAAAPPPVHPSAVAR